MAKSGILFKKATDTKKELLNKEELKKLTTELQTAYDKEYKNAYQDVKVEVCILEENPAFVRRDRPGATLNYILQLNIGSSINGPRGQKFEDAVFKPIETLLKTLVSDGIPAAMMGPFRTSQERLAHSWHVGLTTDELHLLRANLLGLHHDNDGHKKNYR